MSPSRTIRPAETLLWKVTLDIFQKNIKFQNGALPERNENNLLRGDRKIRFTFFLKNKCNVVCLRRTEVYATGLHRVVEMCYRKNIITRSCHHESSSFKGFNLLFHTKSDNEFRRNNYLFRAPSELQMCLCVWVVGEFDWVG